jgi:excisionase family DNA binding protein
MSPDMAGRTPPALLMTIPQVCASLNLSKPTVNRLLARGAISSVRVGRSRRIPLAAVERFVADLIASKGQGAAR